MVVYLVAVSVLLFLLVVGLAALYIHIQDRKYAHIPGPKNDSFWLGCFPSYKASLHEGRQLKYIHSLFQIYGKTFKIRILFVAMICSVDSDAVKELLVSGRHSKGSMLAQFFGKLFGVRYLGTRSILTESDIDRAQWKRTQYNTMFHKGYFKGLIMELNTSADPLMRRLTEVADGKTRITMLDEFQHVTLDVLAQIAFGLEANSVDSVSSPFTSAILTVALGLQKQFFNPLYQFNPRNWSDVRKAREAVALLRGHARKTIEDRAVAKARGDYTPDDILTLIVDIKEKNPELDGEELIDDFATFFAAGTETTAATLAFVLLSIGRNPEIMKKLQDEVDDVIGEKSVIDNNDLNRMTYMDMVIKETLRVFPPIGAMLREANHQITIDDLIIPKGSTLYLSNYSCGLMEEYFEEPEQFYPERFSTNHSKKVDPYVYFPFSLGPRTCIGKYFADIEAKIILAKFVQRFEFVLDPTQSFEPIEVVTLRPKDRCVVTLTTRGQ